MEGAHAPATDQMHAAGGASDVVVAAAGDIACDPNDPSYNSGVGTASACRMKYTSDLLVNMNPAAVFTLGDNEQSDGALWKFQQSYDPTWGRVKSITHPAVGNHEYGTSGASGYFSYFGTAAGDPSKGYYSFDIGAWHIVVLNGNCDMIGGCGVGSPQEQWLKANLAASPAACTLAYWHQPRFSSGGHGDNPAYDVWWQDLYNAGAEVVLNGHDHYYERFAPQTPQGIADQLRGIREFVVGTGGRSHSSFGSIHSTSEVRNSDTFGVLKLTLYSESYDWQFVPESGKEFTDRGTSMCHSNFNFIIPISSAGTDVVNAPAGSVIYVLPDWQSGSGHTKPSDVQPAALSDFTALGFMFGASDNMQIMALDTNSTYFDPATGAPKVSNSVLVVFAGPLVNGVVNYYEDTGMSPLHFTYITVGGVPTYAFYDWQGNLAASMPVSAGQAGTSDIFLVEYFKDANNNNVFIIYGFAWKGTYTGGVFFKAYILPNITGFTHGWYIYQWNDTNGNGLPEAYEANTTPVNYGD